MSWASGEFGGASAVGSGPRARVGRRRERAPVAQGQDRSAGFAAVDALVALTVLSATVLLGLRAAETASRAADAAAETRHAAALTRYLLDRPAAGATREGRTGGFAWRLAVTPLDSVGDSVQRCARRAELHSARSGRRFAAATVDFCRPEPGGAHGG